LNKHNKEKKTYAEKFSLLEQPAKLWKYILFSLPGHSQGVSQAGLALQ
jgi:hypothetical protein